VRLGAVGDVVRTLPAASSLRARFAGAHFAWLVEPAAQSAVAAQPWIDEVLVFPRGELVSLLRRGRGLAAARLLRRFVARLRRRRFDSVIDFHGIAKSALLALASGAPRRVGFARPFAREGAWLLSNERLKLAPGKLSRFERAARLAAFVAPAATPAPQPFHVAAAARERFAALLGPRVPVAMQPGTSPATPHKRWRPAHYGAVARRLRDEAGIASIVLAGPTPGEDALADAVVAASDGAARRAPPTASLGELAALLASCRLYVGGDTGPLHVASLVGTPVVQILGPTDPIENAPWPGTPSRTVREPVACAPCRRGCAAAPCMRRVAPDAVLEAARALLAAGGRGC
jgi:ADP-heptose:LPS heptosyltransferase